MINIANKSFFFVSCFFLIFPSTAYAYFDPGTGSMLLQVFAAGFVGVLVFWGYIKNFIRKIISKKDTDQDTDQDTNK